MGSPHNSFVHLHTHSAYSLAEGAIHLDDLIALCVEQNMPALAVTDTNNLFGALEFAQIAIKKGVQPIIGCQVTLENDKSIVLLVQNETGYQNLSYLISNAYLGSEGSKDTRVSFDSLQESHEGLICLSGGAALGVTDTKALKALKDIFVDRFYIELQRHGLSEETRHEESLIDFAYAEDIPLVASNDIYFGTRNMHEAHDALLCIAEGRYVSEEDRRTATKGHYFKSAEDMTALFADLPEAVGNTAVIAQRCHFLLQTKDPILPPFATEDNRSEIEELKSQAEKGLEWRLEHYAQGEDPQPYRERLEYELGVIEQMGFPGYFLIVSDFIKWTKDQGIPVGPGRGSGAGSVVAWALKITDLDPLQFNLLFERFLNPERISMPDFDIDFCQDRRDEVIRYVQERYGYDRVAQIITFGKLQARAVVRDVGRVLQMPYGLVDRIAKLIPNNPAHPVTLEEALLQDADLRAEADKDDTNRKLINIALKLEGLYRHASTHAAGLVIGDRPLYQLVPLYRDPRSEMPVTQFNMKFVEKAGLVKFDFLGLKTLTVIQKAAELIEKKTKKPLDILQIPLDNKPSYELLSKGNSAAVFQLESSGMRDILRKMGPNRFEDIIALVALYRPGPMDNIPKYIAAKTGAEEADYLHPKLQPILEETFGIMIYQEQVMQAAQILSGYTLGSADLLRRAMGKKIKAEMDAQKEQFVQGAADSNDVPQKQAETIFEQIAKFAGYGFNKSHAAAYALIAYQTAWLKANYPVEFMAATMTLDCSQTEKLCTLKQAVDRMDITLLPPSINHSLDIFSVEGEAIRYALAALKGVGEAAMDRLVKERDENGPFKDLADFMNRIDPKSMNKRQFEKLIAAGALDCIYPNRAELYENTEMLLRHASAQAEEKELGQNSLFGEAEGGADSLPPMVKAPQWGMLEKLQKEFEAVGFYISAHPLDSKAAQLSRLGIVSFIDIEEALKKSVTTRLKMAGVLIKKQEKISKKGNKYAFLQLSDSTGVYEVTLFSDLLSTHREILEAGEPLFLAVDVDMSDGQQRLTCQELGALESKLSKDIKEIHVHMSDVGSSKKLQELLQIEGKGRSKIVVCVAVQEQDNQKHVMLEIPGKWRFSEGAFQAIRSEPGIIDIQTF